MRTVIFFAVFFVGGCTSAVSPRNSDPEVAFVARGSLDTVLGCVISHMSDVNPWNYPFRGVIVAPNEVYEVHPIREVMVGGEPVYVEVRNTQEGVNVRGFAIFRFRGMLQQLEPSCR